jgi:hypothetical protein
VPRSLPDACLRGTTRRTTRPFDSPGTGPASSNHRSGPVARPADLSRSTTPREAPLTDRTTGAIVLIGILSRRTSIGKMGFAALNPSYASIFVLVSRTRCGTQCRCAEPGSRFGCLQRLLLPKQEPGSRICGAALRAAPRAGHTELIVACYEITMDVPIKRLHLARDRRQQPNRRVALAEKETYQ